MADTKTFPTHLLLTLATGVTMEACNVRDIHQLVGHLAGGPVWTHQLPFLVDEAAHAATAALGEAFEPFDPAQEGYEGYRDRMIAKLGPALDVLPAAKPFHRADAVHADAVELMGGDASRVITVGLDKP